MNVGQELVSGIDGVLREAMSDSFDGVPDSAVVIFAEGETILAIYDVPNALSEATAAKLVEASAVLGRETGGDVDDPNRLSALFAAIKHHRHADGGLDNAASSVVATAEVFREFLVGGPSTPAAS